MSKERFESILVDVDATAAIHHELDRAVNIARHCGATLTIVDSTTASADAPRLLSADVNEDIVATRRQQLVRLAHRVSEVPTTSRLLVGHSATVLIQDVLRSNHDLLVRSHARDLTTRGSKRYGAVNAELLRKCPCSVLLVGPGRTPERPLILGAVSANTADTPASALSLKVVEVTRLMASLEDGAPMLLQTWVPFAEELIRTNSADDAFAAYVEAVRHRTSEDLASLTKSFNGNPSGMRTTSRRGQPEDVIPEFVVREGVDLVVMASPTSNAITGMFFRSASEKLLHRLTCSLLAVKPDDAIVTTDSGDRLRETS